MLRLIVQTHIIALLLKKCTALVINYNSIITIIAYVANSTFTKNIPNLHFGNLYIFAWWMKLFWSLIASCTSCASSCRLKQNLKLIVFTCYIHEPPPAVLTSTAVLVSRSQTAFFRFYLWWRHHKYGKSGLAT